MDASEIENDSRLYKASGDLIPELQKKLPKLIWHDDTTRKHLRTHILWNRCEELRILLDRFQEWPQLLDSHLAAIVEVIVDGFLRYITFFHQNYHITTHSNRPDVIPLPRGLCFLLYALCKVRGHKVIVRLLNNEPKYLAPLLMCLRRWGKPQDEIKSHQSLNIRWEERYIMLLWISHLMLAPFELLSLSTVNNTTIPPSEANLYEDLPPVAVDVLSIAFASLDSPSKERESAVTVMVRLSLRRDMQAIGLPNRLVKHTAERLHQRDPQQQLSVHHVLGYLSLLYSVVNLGTDTEVTPFLFDAYQTIALLISPGSSSHESYSDSAPARKLIIKIMRAVIYHAIALQGKHPTFDDESVNAILENGIQYFLEALGDKDTPVRMAASKALSIVTLKLDPLMSAEVVEAVLGIMSENMLLEDPKTNQIMPVTDRPASDTIQMRRNVSSVNPLKWHGSMLALGHFLFRRSPPTYQLPDIIESLLLGLEFEQRSNVGTSVGVGVRDAACFGIWSLSRKYSTAELEVVNVSAIPGMLHETSKRYPSVLQLIASHLIISGCFDPSGNIRRGSSAALQELIGRHPDTILQGIPVVQCVDYHAVARRFRAMTEVGPGAASLDPLYHDVLLNAIQEWRGARATDADSRRWAATTMRKLSTDMTAPMKIVVLKKMVETVRHLKPANSGSNASARHGLLLCIAAIVDSFMKSNSNEITQILLLLENVDPSCFSGNLDSRTTIDLENAMEGVCAFLAAAAKLKAQHALISREGTQMSDISQWFKACLPIINRCTIATDRVLVIDESVKANLAFFDLMLVESKIDLFQHWLNIKTQKPSEAYCKGRLISIGALYHQLNGLQEIQGRILDFLETVVQSNGSIETRTNAMESFSVILKQNSTSRTVNLEQIIRILTIGLNDYTSDQRGDVGSHIRLQSLEAVSNIYGSVNDLDVQVYVVRAALPYVVRLAAEKLNKVRYRAWICLRDCWLERFGTLDLASSFDHLADVSSVLYYKQLMQLLQVEMVRDQFIIGLCSSATGSTDEIGRACCSAFNSYLLESDVHRRNALLDNVTTVLLNRLYDIASQEDREVVPVIEFLSFLVEQQLLSAKALSGNGNPALDVWTVMQKVHSTNSILLRVEAAVRLYGALLQYDDFRGKALDKLTRQLLHRWPKIRNSAAEYLYFDAPNELLISCDWNAPVTANKPTVLTMRKSMRIAVPG